MTIPSGWVTCADESCGGICKSNEATRLCKRCREAQISREFRLELTKEDFDVGKDFKEDECE
jgi:hypothetical protein